ncbi:MAG: putative lytic transglycosylase MltA-interacting protein MipA [Rhodocyclales bacterium]|nr:putative lytic transglycosylase MltA-interacting protein MipA [Rhodocyclales bacterium]
MLLRPPAASLLFALTALGIVFTANTVHAQVTPATDGDTKETSPGPKLEQKLEALIGNTPDKKLPPKMLPLWEFGLGVGGFNMPDYRGSDHQSSYLFPFPYVVYRGSFLKADRSGVSGRFFDGDRLDLELSMSGGAPVRSKNNEARAGMPDLKPMLELGPQAIIRVAGEARDVTRLDIRLPFRQALTTSGAVGWVFTPALNLSVTPRDKWQFGAQVGLYYATTKYHRYIYEVAPQYATATRAAYTPKAGYGGWQVTTSLSRRFDKMFVGGFLRASSVSGAVFEASPLVRRKTNFYAGFGISWLFAASSEMVPQTDDE